VIEKTDIILICCENLYLPKICEALLATELTGKIIIDCTNGLFHRDFHCNTSYIQQMLGDHKLYKAFNNLGIDYPESDMMGFVKGTYFCGDDTLEKLRVKKLIVVIGFKAIDVGDIQNALLLEAFYHLRKEITLHKAERQIIISN
jgi:predicted dinucleotide-binding enzyme